MPGQYKHLCRAFAQESGNTVVFVTKPKPNVSIPGVHKVEFTPPRDPSPLTHRYLSGLERGIIQGQEVWRVCKKLRDEEGFTPDVICAHPGWGDAMFIKDVYPDTPLLSYFEFYYHAHGADVNFDPADPVTDDDQARIRVKNGINLFSLESADWGISPTFWQQKQNPKPFRDKISILHDGVDTDAIQPNADATISLPNGRRFSRKDEVVTYVSRNFEPYRGFPTFMHAARLILERRPNCHILCVGADEVSYGKKPQGGRTYRQQYLEMTKPDPNRIHWLGWLGYEDYLKVLRVSSAHIYLTYPFVLSWSMLEAMSAGCLVIGSATPPVEEVIENKHNGLLVDFFSPEAVADAVDKVFAHTDRMQQIRDNARATVVQRYDLKKLLPLHMQLVREVAKGQFPPPVASQIASLYER